MKIIEFEDFNLRDLCYYPSKALQNEKVYIRYGGKVNTLGGFWPIRYALQLII